MWWMVRSQLPSSCTFPFLPFLIFSCRLQGGETPWTVIRDQRGSSVTEWQVQEVRGWRAKLTVCLDPVACIWIVAFKIPVAVGVSGHPIFPRWVWIHSCLTGCTDALNTCRLLSAPNPSSLNQDEGIPGRNGVGGWTRWCISLFVRVGMGHPAWVPVTRLLPEMCPFPLPPLLVSGHPLPGVILLLLSSSKSWWIPYDWPMFWFSCWVPEKNVF